MKSGATTLVYYEDTKKKGIFVSGGSYDVVHDSGMLELKGFVVMDHIPVSEEEMPVFEKKTIRQLTTIGKEPGLSAVKLLKEHKSNTFVILTQWRTKGDHQQWKKQAETHALNFTETAKLPAYFMERPFTNHYYMLQDEDERGS